MNFYPRDLFKKCELSKEARAQRDAMIIIRSCKEQIAMMLENAEETKDLPTTPTTAEVEAEWKIYFDMKFAKLTETIIEMENKIKSYKG